MISVSRDINKAMSSIPPKRTRKFGWHVPPEPGGTWVYISSCTIGYGAITGSIVANDFALVLKPLGYRIGRYSYEDVVSWYIWVPEKLETA